MKFKKCAALLLVSSCLLTGCTPSSAKKVDSKYVVASLEKEIKQKISLLIIYIKILLIIQVTIQQSLMLYYKT